MVNIPYMDAMGYINTDVHHRIFYCIGSSPHLPIWWTFGLGPAGWEMIKPTSPGDMFFGTQQISLKKKVLVNLMIYLMISKESLIWRLELGGCFEQIWSMGIEEIRALGISDDVKVA